MKFFTVFAAILAVALGAKSHWTIDQLSAALENPTTNPSLVPVLEHALNTFMTSVFAGESHQYISVTTAPVDLNTWSLSELSEAIENPNTNPALLPYLENALNTLMNAVFAGEVQATSAQAAITIPALELSYWTLAEVDQALMDPKTSPALIPYLEQALNQMMQNLFDGVEGASTFVLATPVGSATPAPEFAITPGFELTPVDVVDAPVGSAIVNPAASGSPLVQIILNINQQESVIIPTPVSVPDNTEPFPNPRPPVPDTVDYPVEPFPNPRPPVPESVIDPEPVILPSPPAPEVVVPEPEAVIVAPDFNPIDVIAVVPEPDVNPIDVIAVVPEPDVNPIDVIAVVPEPDVNPIDVIAVMPEPHNPIDAIAVAAPDVNPVDLLNPVIVPVAVAGGEIDLGPM